MKCVDLRDPSSFAIGHQKGALNIPYSQSFFHWASYFLKEGKNLEVILPINADKESIKSNFKIFNPNCNYTFFEAVDSKNFDQQLSLIQPKDLNLNQHFVLDVRGPQEWAQGFIKGAIAMELSTLPLNMEKLSKEKSIAVICASGVRSSIGASYLKLKGYNAGSVVGGMNAWQRI